MTHFPWLIGRRRPSIYPHSTRIRAQLCDLRTRDFFDREFSFIKQCRDQ
jgi:hypothetical protein